MPVKNRWRTPSVIKWLVVVDDIIYWSLSPIEADIVICDVITRNPAPREEKHKA